MFAKCPQCGRCFTVPTELLGKPTSCSHCNHEWKLAAPYLPAAGRIAVLVGCILLAVAGMLLVASVFHEVAMREALSYQVQTCFWWGAILAMIAVWIISGGVYHMRQHRREDVPAGDRDGPAQQAARRPDR